MTTWSSPCQDDECTGVVALDAHGDYACDECGVAGHIVNFDPASDVP